MMWRGPKCFEQFVISLIILNLSGTPAKSTTTTWKVRMRPHSSRTPDEYVCIAYPVKQSSTYYMMNFGPRVLTKDVHHMILFGCVEPTVRRGAWNCNSASLMHSPCLGKLSVLYAWTMNASDVDLPKGVSFRAGRNTDINYLVLQIHYKDPFATPDSSGVDVVVSLEPTAKQAGMLLLSSDGRINAGTTDYFEMVARVSENVVMHPFAYRVHAHSLGLVNSLYHVANDATGRQFWTEIGRRSPQLPQNFVAANPGIVIKYGDWVAGVCTMFNPNHRTVRIGPTRKDEMCNIYLLYWVWGDDVLENSIIVAPGPPNEYFHDYEELDVRAVPPSAYMVPSSPNGFDDPAIDDNVKKEVVMELAKVI